MKKIVPILFSLFLVLLCFFCRAQSYNIIKSQAFLRKSTTGNIQVDENGNPTNSGVTQQYLIYIETKGTVWPQWETVYLNGMPHTVNTVEVEKTPVNLGPLKGQKTPVTVSKGKNNRLWQLVVTPQQNDSGNKQPTGNTSPIVLNGNFRNKTFTYRITKVRELAKRFNP